MLAFELALAQARGHLGDHTIEGLRKLAAARTPEEAERAKREVTDMIVVQGAVYAASEYGVAPLLQIVCRGSAFAAGRAIDELIEIAIGEPDPAVDGLMERCHQRIREGLAAIYARVDGEDRAGRIGACELIMAVDPDVERVERVLEAVLTQDKDPLVQRRVSEYRERWRARRDRPEDS